MSSVLTRAVASAATFGQSALNGALRYGAKRPWKPHSKSMVHTRNGPSWPKGTIKPNGGLRWWQPLLGALAAPVAAGTLPGGAHGQQSSRARKRSLVKTQQIMFHHARRIEGVARNMFFRAQKKAVENARADGYIREYAETLRAKALAAVNKPSGAPRV